MAVLRPTLGNGGGGGYQASPWASGNNGGGGYQANINVIKPSTTSGNNGGGGYQANINVIKPSTTSGNKLNYNTSKLIAPKISYSIPKSATTLNYSTNTNAYTPIHGTKINIPSNIQDNAASVYTPKRTDAQYNNQAPQLQAQYTDNRALIQSLYSDDKRKQLEDAYNQQQAALETEARNQQENNIRTIEQSIRDTYAQTNKTMVDLAQIQSNKGGAATSDPTYKQGLITINTGLTDAIAKQHDQLIQTNTLVATELQKAEAQNNTELVKALQDFDTAAVTMYVNEVSRIDSIKNSVNEKNADLTMAQKQLNENSYQFDSTLAQQEKARRDANLWKEIDAQQWQANYDTSIEEFNKQQADKLNQLNLSKAQIQMQANQWATEQANQQMQANAALKYKYDQLRTSTDLQQMQSNADLKYKYDQLKTSTGLSMLGLKNNSNTKSYVDQLVEDISKNILNNSQYIDQNVAKQTAIKQIQNAYNNGYINKNGVYQVEERLGLVS
mgnify:CR=1 FL=1